MRTNRRVGVPVGAFELARRDFLAVRVSDNQVCALRAKYSNGVIIRQFKR